MQLTVTDDGIAATDALKQYLTNKCKRLERMTNPAVEIHVTLSSERLSQVVKALVHAHGTEFYARAESEDLYAAIDQLVDRIELQISKHKQKEKEKRHDKSEEYDDSPGAL